MESLLRMSKRRLFGMAGAATAKLCEPKRADSLHTCILTFHRFRHFREMYTVSQKTALLWHFKWINNICRSAVPAQKYLPERRSAALRHHYTPDNNVTGIRFLTQCIYH